VTTTVAVLVLLMAIGGVVFDRRLSQEIVRRRRAQAQFEQAQKMEAMGQLTGGLAHDLNNLLGIIIGNLDLLKETLPKSSEDQELVDAALESALRGADLNRRLLAFARRQPLQPERTDLADVLAGMTELLNGATGERVTIRMETPGRVWPVKIDPAQLEAAVINLAVNARDAMPDGGTLAIEMRNAVIDDDYVARHPYAKAGEYVSLSVSDSGTGMSPEVQARAFEPFFTTKPVGKGSGLGLSMVLGFAQQSGGHVTIYSEPGRGTTVRLYLPRLRESEPVTQAPSNEDTVPSAPPTGSEIVLVVEDNEAMGEIATRQLTELGYRVVEARNAAEALKIIESKTPIDVMFTDIVMPGALDGIALTREAKRHRPELKVLLTSGFAGENAGRNERSSLPARLLSKPYRKHELAQSMRQALDE
jgi:signal transduction histidine kinase